MIKLNNVEYTNLCEEAMGFYYESGAYLEGGCEDAFITRYIERKLEDEFEVE